MALHLNLIGILLILLALMHIGLPQYFRWKEELPKLNLINQQILQVHLFFIALIVFLMGLLCVTCSNELLTTLLGRKICLGLGLFWGVRLFFQFFVYSPQLWRGKKFETAMHILFSGFWFYLTLVFLLIYFTAPPL